MKYGLLKIGDHVPRETMDQGLQSFVDYIDGPAKKCMSHYDGGQITYNFLIGSNKTMMWSGHLGGYEGVLKTIEPKPNVLIQAITGRANLNGRPFDGSAAQFATQVCKWLDEPEKVIWCLHDDAPIKPWTVDVKPASDLVHTRTASKVLDLTLAQPVTIFDS